MASEADQREIKRELRKLNSRLAKIGARIKLIYFMTFLLPVLAAAGGGFYYFGGVDLVKRTYQQIVGSDTDGPSKSKSDSIDESSASGTSTDDSTTDRETGDHRSSPASEDSTQNQEGNKEMNDSATNEGPAEDWNPGGEETEKAKRRREGFREKSPTGSD